jgi:hypothetical protein
MPQFDRNRYTRHEELQEPGPFFFLQSSLSFEKMIQENRNPTADTLQFVKAEIQQDFM